MENAYATIRSMLGDFIPFEHLWNTLGRPRAVISFVRFIEKKLGASFVYDNKSIPLGKSELIDLFDIGEKLKEAGVIKNFGPIKKRPDEPPLFLWRALIQRNIESASGGGSNLGNREALSAALAEALERYLWHETADYFLAPIVATTMLIKNKHLYISPESFVGFSENQRNKNKTLTLGPEAKYLWVKGNSLTHEQQIYIPAQTVSGWHGSLVHRGKIEEPYIREIITTGLATWPTREGAVLRGALEIVERDAYMIMWLNQISLPVINLVLLAKNDVDLRRLLEKCERYRLEVHLIQLITDAPTHAVCAILKDKTSKESGVTLGLKAGPSLQRVAMGAITEALRIRYTARIQLEKRTESKEKKGHSATLHHNRLLYWTMDGQYKNLAFMKSGKEITPHIAPWEKDSEEEHLSRLTVWCREKKYELASVSLGTSEKNPTRWHVEMVVMPELQPMHQNEKNLPLGGERLKSIPRLFGYEPRAEPFVDRPHPFI